MKLLPVMLLIAMPVFSAVLETPASSDPGYGQKFQTFCFCATSLTATMQMFGYNDDSSGSETKGFVTANICASGAELIASEPSEGKSNKPVILTFPSPVFNYDYKAFCYWSENCELEIDKPVCANIFKMNFFNSDGTPKAIIDSDQFIVKGLKPGRYCIELEANEKINMIGSLLGEKEEKTDQQKEPSVHFVEMKETLTNLESKECKKRDGRATENYVSRMYFDWEEGSKMLTVSVTMDSKTQKLGTDKFQDYTITLKRTRPIIHIHDIGDGPAIVGENGEAKSSMSMLYVCDKLPYFIDINPCNLVEFAWDSSSGCLSDYADNMKNNSLDKFVNAKFKDWPLAPIYYCNGVGGLILVEQMKNSAEFCNNIGGIIFVATPFFGSELAHFARNNLDLKDKVDAFANACEIVKQPVFSKTSDKNLSKLSLGCEESWNRAACYDSLKDKIDIDDVYVFYADNSSNLRNLLSSGCEYIENRKSNFGPIILGIGGGFCLALVTIFTLGSGDLILLLGISGTILSFGEGAWSIYNESKEIEQIEKIKDKDGLIRELCLEGDGMVSTCSARLRRYLNTEVEDDDLGAISHENATSLPENANENSPHNLIFNALSSLSKKSTKR